ncbi:hypothetical protein I316_07156 [Kwoniella heveanensis BCC8398]|uniref:Uncharacterized protein n=1 Tax=Kwoniella heveanensis BCC8398 TaxID=1296120 RepID=A0A1B9GJK8_9TREE|nr:hypothetical protein I316_07156 [Kwoniella heveanensis BCC8398]
MADHVGSASSGLALSTKRTIYGAKLFFEVEEVLGRPLKKLTLQAIAISWWLADNRIPEDVKRPFVD